MIRAILFDMDGTLVDTEQQTLDAIKSVVERRGLRAEPYPPELACGRSWSDIAVEIRARYPIADSITLLVSELQDIWDQMVEQAQPLPGVQEAIRAAHRAGILLGVVSSSPRRVIQSTVLLLGVSELISVMIGSDDVTKYKPDPQGYLLGAERLGASPSECLVFEDSSSGMRAAKAAGMYTIAVLCASHERDLVCQLSGAAIEDYRSLSEQFFQSLRSGHPTQKILEMLTR